MVQGIRVMEHLSCEERITGVDLLSLEKRRLQSDLIVAFQYLKETYKRAEEGFFPTVCSDRICGDGFKLRLG